MVKLKRFLLRYDPPGVGLEVEEEEGPVSVRHKSMPPAAEVHSSKEIEVLVDNLIMEEEFLTKRRHRPALMQLLGRLYQVEIDPTDDEGGEPVTSPGRAEIECGLQEGQAVVLINLKGKLLVHNGEMGVVLKAKKDKYEVQLAAGRAEADGPLKVKGSEHIVALAPKGTLSVGAHVAIRGLRNHTELNGCLGRVVECHEETHRFEVRATESGQLFRVKQENLIPIEPGPSLKENREPNIAATPRKKDPAGPATNAVEPGPGMAGAGDGVDEVFEPGSQVQLVGLKTAMCYNGQQAEVLSVDRVRCRYEIRLNDGSVKTIRAENVRLISPPSKSSPRTRRGKEGAGGGQADRSKMR